MKFFFYSWFLTALMSSSAMVIVGSLSSFTSIGDFKRLADFQSKSSQKDMKAMAIIMFLMDPLSIFYLLMTVLSTIPSKRFETNKLIALAVGIVSLYGTYSVFEMGRMNKVRIGCTCEDGWRSNATGSGACSHHEGVDYWLYKGDK